MPKAFRIVNQYLLLDTLHTYKPKKNIIKILRFQKKK